MTAVEIRPPVAPFTAETARRKVRLAVRFAYASRDAAKQWSRSHGNENWEFDARGSMTRRHASIDDQAIADGEQLFHWPLGRRPDDHPGSSQLGL